MTEWKVKLTGRLFTPTVCLVSLATQLQAAAIRLCQLIKNYNLLVCEKKTQPPFNWAQYLQNRCVFSACRRRGDRLFCLRFVASSSSCRDGRSTPLLPVASSLETSSVSPFPALWGGWKPRRIDILLSWFTFCILGEDWLHTGAEANPRNNNTDRKCNLKLPVWLVAPKHDRKTLLNLYSPPSYVLRYFKCKQNANQIKIKNNFIIPVHKLGSRNGHKRISNTQQKLDTMMVNNVSPGLTQYGHSKYDNVEK